MTPARLLLLHASSSRNATLAYQHGWPGAFVRYPFFEVTPLNLADAAARLRLRAASTRRLERRFDGLVVLHSVFSNECVLSRRLLGRVAAIRVPKVFFVGNEYKLMPEKMAFADALGLALLVSQLSSSEAHALYRERLGCEVVGIPNAGFDPVVFAPALPRSERPVDVGYRAFPSPLYLGHDERRELAAQIGAAAPRRGLVADISLDPRDRFDERGWAGFLNRCRAQAGSEAGGDRFELTDATRVAVNAYLDGRPDASVDEIQERFFKGPSVSGRALSGRIVEAAATMTTQLLLEGDYGGYFSPDVHYVPLRKDFSNLDLALERLRDESECRRLAAAAYEVAQGELTYRRLLDRFRTALQGVLDG